MTREEAITRLKNMAWLYGSVEREQNIEAIDMAIEALSAEYEDYEHANIVDIKEPLKVAVLRCKDCRYFKKIVERSDSGLCHRDIVASAWKENGYCSRGERKSGDTE